MVDDDTARARGRLRRVLHRGALAVAVVGAINAGIVWWFLDRTEAHGTTIFLAGRQKTLALEIYRRSSVNDSTAVGRSPLDSMLDEFEETLELLRYGGEDGGAAVPPAPAIVSGEIERIETDWQALRRGLDAGADIDRIRSLTDRLASDADAMVAALRDRRQTYRHALAVFAGVTSLFFLAVSLAGARFFEKRVAAPARRLQTVAKRALEREPAPSLELPPDHELGAAAEAVTNLTTRLEEVRSERDLAQADYRAIFDNALAGIYQIDGDGKLRLANAALAELLGYDSAAELEHAVTDARRELFIDVDLQDGTNPVDGQRRTVETKMRRRDGTEVWVLESSRPSHRDAEGGREGVVFDISPRKKAFDALRRLTGRLMEIQDEERRRLARELHDSMGQLLAAMKMNLTRLEDTTELSPDASELLRDSLELGEEASRQTRSMSHLLHPPLLEELGLEHAIRDYAAGYQERSGIVVDVDMSTPERLPSSLETCVFRFVQECLTNVHRHSGSERAAIRVRRENGHLRAEVEDSGSGLPSSVWRGDGELESLGVGLRGLHARLDQLGGRLEIQSSGSGTVVSAVLPVDSASAPRN